MRFQKAIGAICKKANQASEYSEQVFPLKPSNKMEYCEYQRVKRSELQLLAAVRAKLPEQPTRLVDLGCVYRPKDSSDAMADDLNKCMAKHLLPLIWNRRSPFCQKRAHARGVDVPSTTYMDFFACKSVLALKSFIQ